MESKVLLGINYVYYLTLPCLSIHAYLISVENTQRSESPWLTQGKSGSSSVVYQILHLLFLSST